METTSGRLPALMSMTLAVPAVAALDRGLDEARVALVHEREIHDVARMHDAGAVDVRTGRLGGALAEMARDGVAHERTQLAVSH
jgi:hypothetical protein